MCISEKGRLILCILTVYLDTSPFLISQTVSAAATITNALYDQVWQLTCSCSRLFAFVDCKPLWDADGVPESFGNVKAVQEHRRCHTNSHRWVKQEVLSSVCELL